MGFHRSKVDLAWADTGDYAVDPVKGDLQDTTSLQYRAFIQQIVTRIQSSRGDWRLQPTIGTDLDRYLGKPNTSKLGTDIRNSVMGSLTTGGLMAAGELTVDVFPIDKHQVAILLRIQPSGDREQIRLSFTYNSQDNKVIPRNL